MPHTPPQALQSKLARSEEARKAQEKQIADLRDATAQCTSELLAMQQRAEGVGRAKDAEKEREATLAAQATRQAEDNRALQRSLADTEVALRAAHGELAGLAARLNRTSDTNATLKQEAQALREALAAQECAERERDAAHRAHAQADADNIRALQTDLVSARAAGERASIEVKGTMRTTLR